MMYLEKFLIELDNESNQAFSPGQNVTGRVVLQIVTRLKTTEFLVVFIGKATSAWTEDHGKKSFVFRDSETFFHFSKYFVGKGNLDNENGNGPMPEMELPTGESSYPFSFQLPFKQLPTSFSADYGKIEYTLVAIMKTKSPKLGNFKAKLTINVSCPLDLNSIPEAAEPGDWVNSKELTSWCCSKGLLSMTARINQKGFCPGERIVVEGQVTNESRQGVLYLFARLIEYTVFHANCKTQEIRKPLVKVDLDQKIEPGERNVPYRIVLPVPRRPFTNVHGCTIINILYVIKVKAYISALVHNLTVTCPIFIGTVPLRELEPTEIK